MNPYKRSDVEGQPSNIFRMKRLEYLPAVEETGRMYRQNFRVEDNSSSRLSHAEHFTRRNRTDTSDLGTSTASFISGNCILGCLVLFTLSVLFVLLVYIVVREE